MYEGTPTHPGPDRWWDLIEKWGVTIFYTAPTAIRTFIRLGDEHPKAHDLSSLRLLGSVGEPINPEAWMWYHRVIGGKKCPIVDTWWQTETGGIMISSIPGAVDTKPGSATKPFPGVHANIYDEEGNALKGDGGGFLVLEHPWPGMLRGIWGDPKRFKETYWSKYDETYFAGDGAHRDKSGYFWIMGRVDDVMNVSGHRIGTMEVESALVSSPDVAEAAVVGRPDDITGTAIVAFVSPVGYDRSGRRPRRSLQAARVEGDRRDRAARGDPLHDGVAEDALGQDHAATAARHRLRQGGRRRHEHARGSSASSPSSGRATRTSL